MDKKQQSSQHHHRRRQLTYRQAVSLLARSLGDGGKKTFIRFFITVLLESAVTIAAPLVIRQITNHFEQFSTDASGTESGTVTGLIVVLLGCYILTFVIRLINLRTSNNIAGVCVQSLRKQCMAKINRLPLKYIDSHPLGDTLARVSSDLSNVYQSLQSVVISIMTSVLTVASVLVIMMVIKFRLALVFLIIIPVLYALIALISKIASRRQRDQRRLLGQLNSYITDSCENHIILQTFDYRKQAEKEFGQINEMYYRRYVSGSFFSGLVVPLNQLLTNIGYICVCVIGAVLMTNGELDLGGLQAFIYFISMIQTPNRTLSFNLVSLQNGMASLERVRDFLQAEEMNEEDSKKSFDESKEFRGDVGFSHVQFGYEPDKLLMTDVNFNVKSGMKVAVVGPSGAGKTTLVNLLMRFYDISSGGILIDGVNTRDLMKSSLRSKMGMVLQDSWIFAGTIADNIAYGKEGATREEVIRAAEKTGCNQFIEKFPEGYDTILTEQNEILSEGQKQLLSIARVALADPAILILDEATSQVDTQTESLIMKAIEDIMKGRTSFIIAHRLYTIRNSDMILFMNHGDIVEAGTHEELIRLDGMYASMYREGFDE